MVVVDELMRNSGSFARRRSGWRLLALFFGAGIGRVKGEQERISRE